MAPKNFIKPYLIQNFLEESAKRLPGKVALISGAERLTYSEIDKKANWVAEVLCQLGVQRQDRVGIFLENSAEAVIAMFGILKADAVFIMLSPAMKSQKLSYILNDCQVSVLFTHSDKLEVVSPASASTPSLKSIIIAGDKTKINLTGCPNPILWSEIDSFTQHSINLQPETRNNSFTQHSTLNTQHCNIDLDLATIIYTSGSTGKPKGVMLTHLNIISAAASIISYLENREDDIILNTLPLSFDYGLYQVLMAFKFGGTVVLEKSFTYPYQIIQKMIQEEVTGFPGVPTIFALMLGMKDLDRFDFPSLRYITNTAASLPAVHIKKLRKILPHVRIYSMYGLTECKRVSFLPHEEIDRRPASVGRGMPNEEVWIVDEKGNRVGPDVIGELVVRGSNVMRGYWGLPDETARMLRPGRYPGEAVLYTGDLFRMDEEGFLYFVNRKDDMFKTKGKLVSPREIEECLCSFEGVSDAAVIGKPDEVLGNAVLAFVCSDRDDMTEKDVLKHCLCNLEDHLVPEAIKIVSSLPRKSNGKIDKLALKYAGDGAD
ncbi:MAG: AMP-binding protein [Deltaproteobacteria bacterium]|nr:AMP-binding protein [Deltaproteobacteria bacterium]